MMNFDAILNMARNFEAQKSKILNLHGSTDLEKSAKETTSTELVTELILSKNDLKEVPDFVLKLKCVDPSRITKMNMSTNSISHFHGHCMKSFSNLTHLNATDNVLINLEALQSLSKLKSIDISHNPSLRSLRGLPISLESIYASHCAIEDASQVFRIKNLVTLRLDHNNLRQFQTRDEKEELLCNLHELDLSYNQLANVPNGGVGKNLFVLNLSHNKIQKLPKKWNFMKLEQCKLHFNEIKHAIPFDHPIYHLVPENRELDFPDLVLDAEKEEKIMGKLWISNRCALYCTEFFQRENITHIISVVRTCHPKIPLGTNQYHIPLKDVPEANIKDHFSTAVEFIHEMRCKGESVLVHCNKGRSRSATIVLAYLLWLQLRDNYDENHENVLNYALAMLKSKRPIVKPNEGFLKQLKLYMMEIKNK